MEWERKILDWFAERKQRIEREEREAIELLEEFRRHGHTPRLSRIEVVFKTQTEGERAMAPVPGPATLTAAGQVAIASVLGFDQNDNPMPASFQMPPVTFTIDDPAVATLVENDDGETADVTAVANGIAEVKASVATVDANGNPVTLTDTEEVEVDFTAPPPPTPILTSIKVVFDVQAPPAGASAGSGAAAPEAQATTAAPAGAAPLTPNQKLAGLRSAGSGPVITEIDPSKEPAK